MKPFAACLAVFAVAAISLPTGAAPAGPAPQQGFRATVQTVPIYATVVDKTGRLVPNLEQQHFEILDNDKPQPITLFRTDVLPVSVAIAIDSSGSMAEVLDLVRDAAEAFVLRMLPEDRARIFGFDDKVTDSGAFTSNRDALIRYLRTQMDFGNGTRLWDGLDASLESLAAETSRKVVLVLSDGDDSASRISDNAVLARAHELDAMVYTVGLRNRYPGPYGMVESKPDGALKKISEQTGGGYFLLNPKTELNSTFSRIADELHRQYLLAFSPAVLDGRLHKLEVRIKVPGMTARARRSYQAGPPQR